MLLRRVLGKFSRLLSRRFLERLLLEGSQECFPEGSYEKVSCSGLEGEEGF